MSKKNNQNCNYYNYQYVDLLMPPIDIFNTLCSSNDKTYLFILSFFRVLLLTFITKFFYDITKAQGLSIIVISLLIIYIIINVIILFVIIFKKNKIRD